MNYLKMLFFILLFHSTTVDAQLDKFSWLIGDWVINNQTTQTIEKWEKISQNTIEGISLTYKSTNDSLIFKEDLRILNMGNDIFYIAKVPQNELPVGFKLTYFDNSSFVFTNPNHDFPQKIKYEVLSADSLQVSISKMDSLSRVIQFNFKRK